MSTGFCKGCNNTSVINDACYCAECQANDYNYLTFVVKGPERTAREQMFVRGIVAQTIGKTDTDTVFSSDMRYRDLIAAWFCEVPEIQEGYGYPNGTCLIYSTHEGVQS